MQKVGAPLLVCRFLLKRFGVEVRENVFADSACQWGAEAPTQTPLTTFLHAVNACLQAQYNSHDGIVVR